MALTVLERPKADPLGMFAEIVLLYPTTVLYVPPAVFSTPTAVERRPMTIGAAGVPVISPVTVSNTPPV